MIDVFISYAREDRMHAAELASPLESAGFTVWWDTKLIGGSQFRHVIDQALAEAKKVIVLWSANSVKSAFVVDQAQVAKDNNKLIPIVIGKVKPPLGFRDIHTLYIDQFDDRVIKTVISSIQDETPPPMAFDSLLSRYHRFLFAPGRFLLPLTAVVIVMILLFYRSNLSSGFYQLRSSFPEPKYSVYHSSDLKITFSYPSNILSLNDRDRKDNRLLLVDGEGRTRVKITRSGVGDPHEIRLARDQEVAALEKMNETVTYVALEKEKNWSNWYVISGLSNNTVFYFRRWIEKDSMVSIEFFFPKDQQPLYELVIPAMTQNFVSDASG